MSNSDDWAAAGSDTPEQAILAKKGPAGYESVNMAENHSERAARSSADKCDQMGKTNFIHSWMRQSQTSLGKQGQSTVQLAANRSTGSMSKQFIVRHRFEPIW